MRFLAFLTLTGVCFLSIYAADTPPTVVTLHITATDSQDNPVIDLTAAELHVADDAITPNTMKFARLQRSTPETLVVLYDVLNFEVVQRLDLARWLDEALAQLPADAHVFVYILNTEGHIVPVRPVTEAQKPYDAQQVVKKLNDTLAHLPPLRRRDLTDYPTNLFETRQKAIYALAQEMMKIKGHESIFWFSDGIPSSYQELGGWKDLTPNLHDIAARLNSVAISIDGIYPRMVGPTDRNADGMRILADATGGHYDYSKDITTVLNRVRADSLSTYLIQYQATPAPSKTPVHKVLVTCERKGVHLLSEQVYLAAK